MDMEGELWEAETQNLFQTVGGHRVPLVRGVLEARGARDFMSNTFESISPPQCAEREPVEPRRTVAGT